MKNPHHRAHQGDQVMTPRDSFCRHMYIMSDLGEEEYTNPAILAISTSPTSRAPPSFAASFGPRTCFSCCAERHLRAWRGPSPYADELHQKVLLTPSNKTIGSWYYRTSESNARHGCLSTIGDYLTTTIA